MQMELSTTTKNIEEVRKLCLFLSVLMQDTSISSSEYLLEDLQTLKSLSLLCKEVSLFVKPHIEHNFWFVQRKDDTPLVFRWYAPQNMTDVILPPSIFFNKIISIFSTHSPIPATLTHIVFSYQFNLPIDLSSFTSIKHIEFGLHFNQIIDNNLPINLTHLTFNYCFKKPVKNLPRNLVYLKFGVLYNEPVNGNLPSSLKHLHFDYYFNHRVSNLPPFLTHLTLGENFFYKVDDLPLSLTHLKFKGRFNHPVPSLPRTLLHLTFSDRFNHPINGLQPPNLTFLYFG
eukprot:TRINITY_DN6763_c0_g1_i1.p1 TRINITY_DN6763_c0_g1~~TRINITY_DN6763_c0_g1_i1.p1  ORF type:complete len:286 (+),score=32.36 TRINITY_DN6763_c0_g1_i1:201-1058(+)